MKEGVLLDRETELQQEGWIKRTILDEPRLSEVAELYESLGFEVLIEPTRQTNFGPECNECYAEHCDKFFIIYVRTKMHIEKNDSLIKL